MQLNVIFFIPTNIPVFPKPKLALTCTEDAAYGLIILQKKYFVGDYPAAIGYVSSAPSLPLPFQSTVFASVLFGRP